MAKFKNIKKNPDGSFVIPKPTPPAERAPAKQKKEKTPEPQLVVPLARYTPEPPKKEPEAEVKRPKIVERTKQPSKIIYVPKPAPVKKPEAKPGVRPKKMGLFVVIMFFTVVLQIVLLVSLLYLSPSLVGK